MNGIIHALTPIVWAGVILVMVYFRHQRKLAEINAGRGTDRNEEVDALTSAHAREVQQLRERVRVLERIATDAERHDSSASLARQIDALKD
jgi:hypothetical protein